MNKKDLIKELEYAQKIHKKRSIDLRFEKNTRRIDKRVVGQKEAVIQMLKGNIPVTDNIVRVVKRWRKVHVIWANYIAYYDEHKDQLTKIIKKKINEKGGRTVHWNKRWIKVYDKTLEILEKKN